MWLGFLYGHAVRHLNEPLYTNNDKVHVTSVWVFGRMFSKIAFCLKHHMQWDTKITANLIAREGPCPTPHLSEVKKDKQPPTVLMKLLMNQWYVFRRCTLKTSTEWMVLWYSTWELSRPLVSLLSRKTQIPNGQTSAQDL